MEAGLSFLGLGDRNVVSWRALLNDAQQFVRRAWWLSAFPGLAITLTVLGMNLLADGLNEVWNPRLYRLERRGDGRFICVRLRRIPCGRAVTVSDRGLLPWPNRSPVMWREFWTDDMPDMRTDIMGEMCGIPNDDILVVD